MVLRISKGLGYNTRYTRVIQHALCFTHLSNGNCAYLLPYQPSGVPLNQHVSSCLTQSFNVSYRNLFMS